MKTKFDKILGELRENDESSVAYDWEIQQPTWTVTWDSVEDFISLFFPSTNPTLSISLSPTNILREYWNDVVNPTITPNFTSWSNPESAVINYEYQRDWTPIHNWTTDPNFQDTNTVTNRTVYKVIATDWENRTAESSRTYSFVYPYFWWVAISWDITNSMTETQLEWLSWITKNISYKWNKSVTASPNVERFVLLYPESYWNLSSIIDDNWFETISDYNVSTITITSMLDWTDQNYKYYELKSDTTQTDFTNQFKY